MSCLSTGICRSADDPDRHLFVHEQHPVRNPTEDAFVDLLSPATHDNGAEIIDQGLAKNLAAWIDAHGSFQPEYALRREAAVNEDLFGRMEKAVLSAQVLFAPRLSPSAIEILGLDGGAAAKQGFGVKEGHFGEGVAGKDKGQMVDSLQGMAGTVHRDQESTGIDLAVDDPQGNIMAFFKNGGGNTAHDYLFQFADAPPADEQGVVFSLPGLVDDLLEHSSLGKPDGGVDLLFGNAQPLEGIRGLEHVFFLGDQQVAGGRAYGIEQFRFTQPVAG